MSPSPAFLAGQFLDWLGVRGPRRLCAFLGNRVPHDRASSCELSCSLLLTHLLCPTVRRQGAPLGRCAERLPLHQGPSWVLHLYWPIGRLHRIRREPRPIARQGEDAEALSPGAVGGQTGAAA